MRRLAPRLARAAALAAIALPLWLAAAASLSPEARLFEGAVWLPREPVLEHYRALGSHPDFWLGLRNSLVVAGATTALCLPIASLCAYALARLRFRGRGAILAFAMATAMLPQISIVSPLYLWLRELGLIHSYPGLVLPYVSFALPLCVWLLVGYLRQLPAEIELAALVDGASRARAGLEIVLPLAAPALAATGILTFLYCWNEFLFALCFTLGPERQTLPVAIALLRGQHQVPWGTILAAAVVSSAPVAALVLAFQRRIAAGLVAGAVKG
jgi:ABC-type glycerol-3-phosphate transport system permease component